MNASFNVIDVFGINEDDFTFDFHFILEIQWFNQFISFEFLKANNYDNFLSEGSKEKIWTPEVEFSKINKGRVQCKKRKVWRSPH